MNVTYYNGVYICQCDYEDRTVPKEAGFKWHKLEWHRNLKSPCAACNLTLDKVWWTADPVVAARLREHADQFALNAILAREDALKRIREEPKQPDMFKGEPMSFESPPPPEDDEDPEINERFTMLEFE